MAPLGDATHIVGFRLSGDRPEPIIARALGYIVTPGYDEAMGLRVLEGRFVDDTDRAAGIHAMVVNDEFVRLYLSDGRPVVGRRYANIFRPDSVAEIVGVTRSVLKRGLTDVAQPEYYVVLGKHGLMTTGREINIVIRTTPGVDVANSLRTIVRDVDAAITVQSMRPLAGEVLATAATQRFAMLGVTLFAALAVAVAAVGLHGSLAFAVSRRRFELAIRGALGASRRRLVRTVMSEAIVITGLGIALGVVLAAAGTRVLRSVLFEIDPLDSISFVAGPALLLLSSLIAAALPAVRVLRLNLVATLRQQ
jgi:putative ABC transport system permease protein